MLTLIILLGVSGYMLIEKWDFLDALYMVTITLATVGYREIHPLHPSGIIFTIIFIIIGVISVIYLVSAIIEYMIQSDLLGKRRQRKMEKKLEDLNDHFIICGFGRVGHEVAAEFEAEKIPYMVVDIKNESALELGPKNIPYVIGNVSSDEVLEKAGIKRAKGLIACADSDTENVYVTLAARVMNPNIYIVARGGHKETAEKLKKAGANKVVSPYLIAGRHMASSILRPVAVDFLDIAIHGGNIELWMNEIKIEKSGKIANKTIGELNIRKGCGALVLAVKKNSGQFDFNPCASTKLETGDVIVALGTTEQLKALNNLS